MTVNDNILIIGGDLRQKYLYHELKDNDYSVSAYDVPEVDCIHDLGKALLENNVIILPVPFTKNNITVYSGSDTVSIDYLLANIKPFSTIYGGCFNPVFREKCKDIKCILCDFMGNGVFEVKNSIATAEGAIAEAIIHSPVNLHMSECLVLGYGKCGCAIAKRLDAFSANITIAVRSTNAKAQAFEAGYKYIDINDLTDKIQNFDFVFNSVPALVLTKAILKNAKKDVTIIDIASKPGGTDFKACGELGLNASLCLSLPGKYSPKTSARIILDCLSP